MDQRLLSLLTVAASTVGAAAATAAVLHFTPAPHPDFLSTVELFHRVEQLEKDQASRERAEEFFAARVIAGRKNPPVTPDAFGAANRDQDLRAMKDRVDALCAKAGASDPSHPYVC